MKLRRSIYYSRPSGTRKRGRRVHRSVLRGNARRRRFRAALIALFVAGAVAAGLTWLGASPEPPAEGVPESQRLEEGGRSPDAVSSPEAKSRGAPKRSARPAPSRLRLTLALPESSPGGGEVYCGLFDEHGWPWEPVASDVRAATQRFVQCEFEGLHPGKYAVAAFYDGNGNQDLDRDWLGMPAEPWALSRGVRPQLPLPPPFTDVSIRYGGGEQEMRLQLRS